MLEKKGKEYTRRYCKEIVGTSHKVQIKAAPPVSESLKKFTKVADRLT